MDFSPLRNHLLRCATLLLFLLPLCSAQYDDTTVAIAVVVAVALLLIALAAISIVVILIIHWWRQHKRQHIIHKSRRRAGQRRREIIAINTASSSASDSPPKPRSSTGKRVKWSLDEDKVETTSVPKATVVKVTETASGSRGSSAGKELVTIPVHTVDVPAPVLKTRAKEQQQLSTKEQKLDIRAVGTPPDGEPLEVPPPEESDNLLDHEATEGSNNEEDSDAEAVSFI